MGLYNALMGSAAIFATGALLMGLTAVWLWRLRALVMTMVPGVR